MSFANEYKRAVKEINEEIAYYRGFARLDGTAEPLATLEELRDDWEARRLRFEGRGRPPSEPEDWDENKTTRVAAKEQLDKIIKAAAAAEEAKRASAVEAARRKALQPDEAPPTAAHGETRGGPVSGE
jgi:hypothetical protein